MKQLFLLCSLVCMPFLMMAQAKNKKKDNEAPKPKQASMNALKFRCVGPSLTSGRIADIAVNPNKHSEYYVAVASGNVWKTTNAGTTYQPIFEHQGSYSVGCISLAPSNSNIVWVGTSPSTLMPEGTVQSAVGKDHKVLG